MNRHDMEAWILLILIVGVLALLTSMAIRHHLGKRESKRRHDELVREIKARQKRA
jgi:hypothetical protein